MAFFLETFLKIKAPIISGNSPTLTSGVPNFAESLAMTMSQASMKPVPPARQCPLTRATVGLEKPANRLIRRAG